LLELLDRFEQRVVLGFVETLHPPYRQLFLRQRVAGESAQACGYDCAGPLARRLHVSSPGLALYDNTTISSSSA
jgi:hypothetical protein